MNWQTIEKFLVDNYKDAPKWLSMWVMIILACAPQLYDLAVQYHILDGGAAVPASLTKLINTIGFLGAAFRIMNQAAIAQGVAGLFGKKSDPTDQAGA